MASEEADSMMGEDWEADDTLSGGDTSSGSIGSSPGTPSGGIREAVDYVLSLVARKEYAESEIREKLLRRWDPRCADEALAYCVEQGYVDNARYASMFVRYRGRNHYGPVRILRELAAREIRGDAADLALEECEVDFGEAALEYARKNFRDGDLSDPAWRGKAFRRMAGRGYTADQIRYALDALKEEMSDRDC